MSKIDSKHFAIAPTGLDDLHQSDSRWTISIEPRVGEKLDLPDEPITRITGYHPALKATIQIDQKEGVQITEGVYQNNTTSGRMGASMFGSSQAGRMGYSLIDQVVLPNGKSRVLFSGTEQKRATVDKTGTVFNIPRGFADKPELTDEQLAILEHEEEVGTVGSTAPWVNELGQPQVTNHHLMSTSAPGQGINIFRFDLPSRLIEEIPDMSNRQKRRWRVSAGFQSVEGKHKAFEGIKRSLFVDTNEVVQQDMWTGPVDLVTYVASARSLQSKHNLDFKGAWGRLKDKRVPIQTRDSYPINPLDKDNFGRLIGGQPGWQWRINDRKESVPLGTISAYQPSTGFELGMADREEATNFDGSVVAMPRAVIMPMIEINGNVYVGGRFIDLPNIGENRPFVATSIPIRLANFTTGMLISGIEADTGTSNIFGKGIFMPSLKQTITFNPNSAHETEAQVGFTLQANPDHLVRSSGNTYQLKGGDPNYVFVPLIVALDSPIGPTAVVAASIFTGAQVVSTK